MADLRVHGATVTVNAPVHEVYQLFTHFDQFPKFMRFVKEVTYLDKEHQRTHWVADVYGHDVWDGVNEDWIEDRQIGWRSTSGLQNHGRVEFREAGPGRTWINAQVMYDPTGGPIGEILNDLGGSNRFDDALQESLDAFAHLVDTAPPGGLDPNSPNYVFGQGNANPQGVSQMAQAGPVLAAGEPGDMVRQPVTGNMVDEGMTPLDLGTVGGGQLPGANFTNTPGTVGAGTPSSRETNPTPHNTVDRTAQSNIGGRNPGEPQTAMGDRDVDATSSRQSARGSVTAPMLSREPGTVNQATGQANSGMNRIEDVESKTGESNASEPPHDEKGGSERRTADFIRERGDTGQNPTIMPSQEATQVNEEENRPQTTHVQNAADTGREVE